MKTGENETEGGRGAGGAAERETGADKGKMKGMARDV